MIQAFTDDPRCACWPFWVLELGPEADSASIEKAARDLLAKLSIGMAGATDFVTPMGRLERDEFLIREARAALQDSSNRLLAEFWYVSPVQSVQITGTNDHVSAPPLFPASVEEWLHSLGAGLC